MLFLGIFDIFSVVLLMRGFYNIPVPNELVIFFAAYLILKGLIFICDIGSMMDVAAGILLILTLFISLHISILLIFATLIGLKGVLTLFSGIH